MDDWDMRELTQWHERNRGFMFALGACLALWVAAIVLLMRY
jgi:hypothetical protein